MNKFGLYNIKTKELITFDAYEDAFARYMEVTKVEDGRNGAFAFTEYGSAACWAIAFIQPEMNRIVQLDRLMLKSKCQLISLDDVKIEGVSDSL